MPSQKPFSLYCFLKFVYITNYQLCHPLVMHPFLRKILDPLPANPHHVLHKIFPFSTLFKTRDRSYWFIPHTELCTAVELLSSSNLLLVGAFYAYLPTLPVFLGVSKFFIKSPDLLVRAPNLPDKMDFWASLCFSLKFSPFFHKILTFFIHCTVSGTFLHMFSQWQRLVRHYNDESAFWSHVHHVRRHKNS